MARDYARIMTAIWRNKEFRALTEQQQRAYLFLVTQPDISAAGVLPLRVRRWADCASSSTPDALAQLFKELEAGRFIVVDWDEEELLIRSFIRWDGGFNNPKRRPVIIRAAEEVTSELITRHLLTEFARCGIKTPPDGPSNGGQPLPDSHADSLSTDHSQVDRVDLDDEPFPQVNSLSGSDADRDSTNPGRVPQPSTHNPQPVPPPAGAVAPGRQLAIIQGGEPAKSLTAQDATAAWVDAFAENHDAKPTKQQRGQASREALALIEAGNPADRVVAAAASAGARGFATVQREFDDLAKRASARPSGHRPFQGPADESEYSQPMWPQEAS